MPKTIQIEIPADDAYRIIEALNYYVASWQATEVFIRDGVLYDGPIHEDCKDCATAHSQVLQYRRALRRFHHALDRIQQSAP